MLDPFPKQEFEWYGWHEILATSDVCANEGYDIMFAYMEKAIQENKDLEMDSNCCDEELLLEGL